MKSHSGLPFVDKIQELLDEVAVSQADRLHEAAHVLADRLAHGEVLHVFGTGHSHMLAEEVFFRAGGLAQVNAILDPGLMLHVSALHSTDLERLEGYAAIVLSRYDLRAGDVLIVVSNSGRNAVPIEAAAYAQQRGLFVIALTSAASYAEESTRHSSGKKLGDVADMVIDTCVPKGDALMKIAGLDHPMGAGSTIIGATLLHALLYEAVHVMLAAEHRPEILVSANVDDPQDLQQVLSVYSERIRHK